MYELAQPRAPIAAKEGQNMPKKKVDSADVERRLAARKKKTAIFNVVPVTDAIMLHYVMNVLYTHFLQQHRLRADWQPNLLMSSRRYLGKLPPAQVKLIAGNATTQASELFNPVLGHLMGVDIRHVVVAFAQTVLQLVDQNRYTFTDDALVLQSLGIVSEAVEERAPDWNYYVDPVRQIFQGFMKQIDASIYFKVEGELLGSAQDVLR